MEKDTDGNISKGANRVINSHNNTIFSLTKEIILLDVDGLFIIEADDRIVVGKKESLSKVHKLKKSNK